MALVLTSAPAVEPVTVAEAKAHLRIDHDSEDALIAGLIVTARLHIEASLGLALITQSWSYRLDSWPAGGAVVLPLRPVQAIAAVRITAADATVATLAADRYLLDGASVPPRSSPPRRHGQGRDSGRRASRSRLRPAMGIPRALYRHPSGRRCCCS